MDYPFVLIENDQLYTIYGSKKSYDLPEGNPLIFDQFGMNEMEAEEYENFYQMFNIFRCFYYNIIDESKSVMGGYVDEFLWESDLFPHEKDRYDNWFQFLALDSSVHSSDIFKNTGYAILNIAVNKSSFESKDLSGTFIFTS